LENYLVRIKMEQDKLIPKWLFGEKSISFGSSIIYNVENISDELPRYNIYQINKFKTESNILIKNLLKTFKSKISKLFPSFVVNEILGNLKKKLDDTVQMELKNSIYKKSEIEKYVFEDIINQEIEYINQTGTSSMIGEQIKMIVHKYIPIQTVDGQVEHISFTMGDSYNSLIKKYAEKKLIDSRKIKLMKKGMILKRSDTIQPLNSGEILIAIISK